MKITKSTEIKVGLLLFSALLLLILVVVFGSKMNIGIRNAEISMLFPNSGGIKISDPIFVNGVKRGSVQSIENYKDSVLIKGNLDNLSDIYDNALPRIMILEITGGKKIELHPGNSGILFKSDKMLRGETPPDLADLIAVFGNASSGITSTLLKLDSTLTGLNAIFADSATVNDLKGMAHNASVALADLKDLIQSNKGNLNETITQLKSISKEMNSLLTDNKGKFENIANNLNEVSNDLKPMAARADSLLADLNKLTTEVNSILLQIENGEGFASKVLFDKKFSDKMDQTFASLDSLVQLIQKYGINVNVRLGTRP